MPKITYAKLMQEAEANWPEDEAYGTYRDWFAPEDDEPDLEAGARQIEHMHKVFSAHDDAADLIRRYDAKLAALRG